VEFAQYLRLDGQPPVYSTDTAQEDYQEASPQPYFRPPRISQPPLTGQVLAPAPQRRSLYDVFQRPPPRGKSLPGKSSQSANRGYLNQEAQTPYRSPSAPAAMGPPNPPRRHHMPRPASLFQPMLGRALTSPPVAPPPSQPPPRRREFRPAVPHTSTPAYDPRTVMNQDYPRRETANYPSQRQSQGRSDPTRRPESHQREYSPYHPPPVVPSRRRRTPDDDDGYGDGDYDEGGGSSDDNGGNKTEEMEEAEAVDDRRNPSRILFQKKSPWKPKER